MRVTQVIAEWSFFVTASTKSMKIYIKKRHVGIAASVISVMLAYLFLNELLAKLSQEDISILIMPSVFLISTVYSFNYWSNLNSKEKLMDEVSRDVAKGDLEIAQKVKEHLWNKFYEETYTVNIIKGGDKK